MQTTAKFEYFWVFGSLCVVIMKSSISMAVYVHFRVRSEMMNLTVNLHISSRIPIVPSSAAGSHRLNLGCANDCVQFEYFWNILVVAFVASSAIKSSISMPEAIDCVAKGFSDFNDGLFHMPQRTIMDIEAATVLTMPCYRKDGKYFVIKVVTVFDQSSIKKDKMVDSSVLVFDSKNGNLLAKLDGDSITAIRTGAASGIATKYFSSPLSEVLAIFGTGVQALTQIEAVISCRPIKKVFVFSRNVKSAKRFSDHTHNLFSIDVMPGKVKDLKNADVICTATPSEDSLFKLGTIKRGVHINAIGSFKPSMREIHCDIINSSKIIVDSLGACKKEAGDLIQAKNETSWDFDNVSMQLGEVFSKQEKLNDLQKNITLFKSVGLAFQDLVMAEAVMHGL